MATRRVLLAVALALASPALADDSPLYLIGTDEKGSPIEVKLDGKDYAERLRAALATIQDATLPALAKLRSGQPWQLRTVVVGAGASAEVGVGSLKVKIAPSFKLAFSNSEDPVLP